MEWAEYSANLKQLAKDVITADREKVNAWFTALPYEETVYLQYIVDEQVRAELMEERMEGIRVLADSYVRGYTRGLEDGSKRWWKKLKRGKRETPRK